jgi:hypothetical protein
MYKEARTTVTVSGYKMVSILLNDELEMTAPYQIHTYIIYVNKWPRMRGQNIIIME